MSKSLIKILSVLLIVGLNWTAISAIGSTFAYFSDTETSSNNTCSAGTLDFSLRSGQNNFVPPEIASNMSPGDSVARDIYIKKEGSLPFKYKAHSEPITDSCDLDLYNVLELKVWYNYYTALPEPPSYHEHRTMALKYNGLLKDFDDFDTNPDDPDLRIPNAHPYFDNVFYGPNEHWLYFQITLPSNWVENNKSCQFKFVFDGWQLNLPNPTSGFSDTEEIYSFLVDSIFIEEFIEEEPVVEDEELISEEVLEEGVEDADGDTVTTPDEDSIQDGENTDADADEETTPEEPGEHSEGQGQQDASPTSENESLEEGEGVEEDVEVVAGESDGAESGEDVGGQDISDISEGANPGEPGDGQVSGTQEGSGEGSGQDTSSEGESPAVLPSGEGSGQGDFGEGGSSNDGNGGGDNVGDSPSLDSGEMSGDTGSAPGAGDTGGSEGE